MPGIGLDIAEVINELGAEVTVIRDAGNFTEKLVYEVNALSANTFLREHLLNCSFTYVTEITTGDILLMDGTYYLVVNKTPDNFENEVVENIGVLYKCNLPTTTSLQRPSETVDGSTYVVTQTWTNLKTPVYGVITQDKRTTVLNKDDPEGKEPVYRFECFIPAALGTKISDRIALTDTEYYRVQDIEQNRFPNVHVVYLVMDNRPTHITPPEEPAGP